MSSSDAPRPALEARPGRRRRPRPRPSDRRGGEGKGGAAHLARVLGRATSLTLKVEIDDLLARRQREGPPPPEEGAAAAAATAMETETETDDGAAGGADGAGDGAADGAAAAAALAPAPAPAGSGRPDDRPTGRNEHADALADVLGRPPPDAARTERHLVALEREVRRLPQSEGRAVMEALSRHRLLFVNCPHTRMMLEEGCGGGDDGGNDDNGGRDDDSNFDAAAAARRLARYWEVRRAAFGRRACYAPGTFAEPKFPDYKCHYERALAVLEEEGPGLDDAAREEADSWVRAVHRVKVEALDAALAKLGGAAEDGGEEEGRQPDPEEERGDTAAGEGTMGRIARAMAAESPDELKLRFLRAEDMIEYRAAWRMVAYWETGLRLFGPGFRGRRHATLGDDMEDCWAFLQRGLMRLMPEEDDFGRSILVRRWEVLDTSNTPDGGSSCLPQEERLSQLDMDENQYAKILWYFLHAALEREPCRRNGVVLVLDLRGIRSICPAQVKKFRALRRVAVDVMNSMPTKTRAVHVLLGPDQPWRRRLLIGGLTVMVNAAMRLRFVVHAGPTEEENLAKLGEVFGIGAGKLAADMGGAVEDEYFSSWLEERRAAGL